MSVRRLVIIRHYEPTPGEASALVRRAYDRLAILEERLTEKPPESTIAPGDNGREAKHEGCAVRPSLD